MIDSTATEVAFLLGRVLFGGTLAIMGTNHFTSLEEMTGYADYKGLPAPKVAVLVSGAALVLGGISLVVGAFPAVGAAAIAAFLLVSAVTIHDFWRLEGEEAQNELVNFTKNVYGAGAALVFVAISDATWPYALNVGML